MYGSRVALYAGTTAASARATKGSRETRGRPPPPPPAARLRGVGSLAHLLEKSPAQPPAQWRAHDTRPRRRVYPDRSAPVHDAITAYRRIGGARCASLTDNEWRQRTVAVRKMPGRTSVGAVGVRGTAVSDNWDRSHLPRPRRTETRDSFPPCAALDRTLGSYVLSETYTTTAYGCGWKYRVDVDAAREGHHSHWSGTRPGRAVRIFHPSG